MPKRDLRGNYTPTPILSIEVVGAPDQDSKNLQYDWDVTIPSNKEIQVQVNFSNALEISQSGSDDQIQVVFEDKSFFLDPDTNEFSTPELSSALPSQMPLECAACDTMGASGAAAE
jgi:hypothetical protein